MRLKTIEECLSGAFLVLLGIYVTENICVTGELRSVINLWFDDNGHS